jgi:crotonobetainyl-CoA:carnitine CoA-transferase CaiB-like acyl-CoA transferase
LSGIKVLDLSRVLAGPYCSMILGDLGAEIIKVEEVRGGDRTRTIPPFVNGESHYFLAINRNKQSICVDLKQPEGREVVLKLAEAADVVLENFRPGVLERLRLGYDDFARVNPRIVMCSISGFGQTGSMRDVPSFDLIAQAMSGLMSINGEADGPPTKIGVPIGDVGGGMWAAIGILAGLQRCHATGKGSHIDFSMLEGCMSLLGYLGQLYLVTGESPARAGSDHLSVVPYGRFPVKDGHIVIALHVGNFWRKFCVAIGREDLELNPKYRTTADRRANREELVAIISEILLTRTAAQWQEIFEQADVPHATVNNVGEAIEQDIVRERELMRTVKHRVAGDVRLVGSPLRFDAFDASRYRPSPLLGEHTRSILARFGYDDEAIDRLADRGVVGLPEPAQQPVANREHQEL